MSNNKRILKNVTLVAVATRDVEATARALQYSQCGISFDRVLLIANYNPSPNSSDYEYEYIAPFSDVGEWGKFVVFKLHKYIETSHIILVHADGFIVNPDSWREEFMGYDYIGAPWPIPRDSFSYRDFFGNIIRVGNSVSLRSAKLLRLPSQIPLDWTDCANGFFHEDGFLSVQWRHLLQAKGIKYAPLDIAIYFSREITIPENKNIHPFAFHKWQGRNKNYPRFSKKESIFNILINFLRKVING